MTSPCLERGPRAVDRPRAGWFRTRLGPGGPLVPARLFRPCVCTVNGPAAHPHVEAGIRPCDRFPPWLAQIGTAAPTADPLAVAKVWTMRDEIDAPTWRHLMATMAWAAAHAPADPHANPRAAVDYDNVEVPFA